MTGNQLSQWWAFQNQVNDLVYEEPRIPVHEQIIRCAAIPMLEERGIVSGMRVLDVGCGTGFALADFLVKGYDAVGITLGTDYDKCKELGLPVLKQDQNWMDLPNSSFDLVFARHVLEHSIMPLWTLAEYWRVLKPGALLYVEVPCPDSWILHERNRSHHSVLGEQMWRCLMERVQFSVEPTIPVNMTYANGQKESYWIFFARKVCQPS